MTSEDYRQELQDAIRSLERDPDNARIYYRRIGRACLDLKDYEKAIKAYDEVIRLSSEPDEGAIYNRGMCHYHLEEYELALADFNRNLELDPDWVWALSMRGRTYSKMEDHERAIADFCQAIKIQPNYEGYLWRGIAYMRMGDGTRAKDDLEKALRLAQSPDQRRTVKKLLSRVNWSRRLKGFMEWLRENQ